ncbi:MAG: MBL fold metallo-hydrolase, partial [Oleibacter sp.]|nr:MBL fold metallo-hydrolase [Thalassolituus sp.]
MSISHYLPNVLTNLTSTNSNSRAFFTSSKVSSIVVSIAALTFASASWAGDEHNHDKESSGEKTAITTLELNDGLYMMSGKGGNVLASVGDDGTFIVDDQYASEHETIIAALKKVGGDTPRFLLNTHWHGDHTGGNEAMGEQGTIIFAHENVRKRLTSEQFVKAFDMKMAPQPDAALPMITFDNSMSLHWNDLTIKAIHTGSAHTDSDSYVLFEGANVVHTGDLYFSDFYPFIDPDSEGSVAGMIEGVNAILAQIDGNTKVVPGHGTLSNKVRLTEY